MKLSTLRKKALDGSMEVEDMLQAAIERQPGLADELTRLAQECGWTAGHTFANGCRTVPWSKWAAVAGAYATDGVAGLAALAADQSNTAFVLGLLQEVHTAESIAFILNTYHAVLADPAQQPDLAFDIAAHLNIMLSFKNPAPVTAEQAHAIERFLLALYSLATTDNMRSTALLALRGTGGKEALAFAESLPDLTGLYQNTLKLVIKSLRKRIKAAKTAV